MGGTEAIIKFLYTLNKAGALYWAGESVWPTTVFIYDKSVAHSRWLTSLCNARRAAELLGVDPVTLVNAMSFRRIKVREGPDEALRGMLWLLLLFFVEIVVVVVVVVAVVVVVSLSPSS